MTYFLLGEGRAINPTLNCDAVISSPYGSLAGVPLAVFGLWFYGVSVLLAATVLSRRTARFVHRAAPVLLVTSAIATLLSVGLAVLSVVKLRALCVLCATLYALNLAMLAAAVAAVRASGTGIGASLAAEWNQWKANGGAAIGWWAKAVAALGVVAVGARAALTTPDLCNAVLAAEAGRSEPVALVVYGDFQCPGCRALDGELRSLRQFSSLRVMPRHYPFDRECNRNVSTTMHAGACLQARAALCAGEQGRYEDYSDRLFDERPADESAVRRLATSLELDVPRFEVCLASD